MKASQLTLGMKMFYSDGHSIEQATVTKLEDKEEYIIVTVKTIVETIIGNKVEEEENIKFDKDAEVDNDVFESTGYLHGNVSLNFDKLKAAELKTLRDNKEDMIMQFEKRIANYEKIQMP